MLRLNRLFLMAILAFALAVCIPAVSANGAEQTYPFRIVQLSDTQPAGEDQWQRMAETVELVNLLKPDIVFFPGDITCFGTESEYHRAHALLSKIEAPLYAVPGNHDTITPAAGEQGDLRRQKIPLYRKYFGEEFWTVEQGDFLFVGIDCTENWPNFTPRRLAWLKGILLSSPKPYKILVTHYTQEDILKSSPKLNQVLISGGVVALMHGHNHKIEAYRDESKTGRLVFSSGSAQYLIGPTDDCGVGVMYFDVYERRMDCFWQSVDGPAKPLGSFDLPAASAAVSRRRDLFDIRPYLQQLQPRKVTIKWQSRLPLATEVKLRQRQAEQFTLYPVPAQPVLHKVTITDLLPKTSYEFSVEVVSAEFGMVQSPTVDFRTPPEQQDSVTFAVYGDTRTQPAQHAQVIAAMMENFSETLDFCLHTGDLVSNGSNRDSWPIEFFAPAEDMLSRLVVLPVLGNHEENSDNYFEFFDLPGNERWFSYDRGPVRIIHLDCYFSSLLPDSEQYTWLRNELLQSNTPWIIVVVHSPFFSSGPHGGLTEDGTPAETAMSQLQTHILPLLEQHGVNLVLSGHDHLYERSHKGEMYFVTAGGGGAPLYAVPRNLTQNPYSDLVVSKHSYCIVEADKTTLSLTAYDVDNEVIDRIAISGHSAAIAK